ncbi:2-polyprenylphenol 6-hydroxylase [Bartonella sp. DGB1]|uniref:2-polyprenylphenol 6-hydroxylase n=1 Tax=Bartonella sp. DGB1 TaxID=3239807 RepID=UPI0035262C44
MKYIGSIFRLSRAFWLIFRAGLFSSIKVPAEISGVFGFIARLICKISPKFNDEITQIKINKLAKQLGPSYIKLGQFLATRPDIIGVNLSNRLTILQDRLEFFSQETAIKKIESKINDSIENIFLSFSPPIAAASIAQVHQAILPDSLSHKYKFNHVAVKIIRPEVRKRFTRDLQDFYFAARLQASLSRTIARLKPIEVVETLDKITKLEMDLRFEAASLQELAENSINDHHFKVPKIIWEYTNNDMLTIEWIDAIKLNDLDNLNKAKIDKKQLAKNLMESFLLHAMRDGFFHADMHAGNVFIDNKANIIPIDFGIMGRLSPETRHFMAQILYGFVKKDYVKVAQAHIDAGYVPNYHDVHLFAQALRAVVEPIYGQSSTNFSMGKLLATLFEITALFDMQTQPQLLLLQKTMVMVEGNARILDNNFNLWETATPILEKIIREELSITAYKVKIQESATNWGQLLLNYPQYYQQQLTQNQNNITLLNEINKNISSSNKINKILLILVVILLISVIMLAKIL